MERRFWLGLAILGALLTVSVTVTVAMEKLHKPAAETFRQAAQMAISGDMDQAVALAQKGRQRWEEGRDFSACVADQNPMDQVENLLAEVEVFAKVEDAEHFAACCMQLAESVTAMHDAHKLSLRGLL